jgi:hypothetical protein
MRSPIVAFALLIALPAAAEPAEKPQPAKRLRTAIGLSYAGLVVPVVASAVVLGDGDGRAGAVGGMIASGALLLGPSAGHCYAGRCWTTGLGLRLAGAGVIAAMVVREQHEPLGVGTVILGGLTAASLWVTGLIWDAVTLPRTVRRANRERALGIAPLIHDGGGGLALAGTL